MFGSYMDYVWIIYRFDEGVIEILGHVRSDFLGGADYRNTIKICFNTGVPLKL